MATTTVRPYVVGERVYFRDPIWEDCLYKIGTVEYYNGSKSVYRIQTDDGWFYYCFERWLKKLHPLEDLANVG